MQTLRLLPSWGCLIFHFFPWKYEKIYFVSQFWTINEWLNKLHSCFWLQYICFEYPDFHLKHHEEKWRVLNFNNKNWRKCTEYVVHISCRTKEKKNQIGAPTAESHTHMPILHTQKKDNIQIPKPLYTHRAQKSR